MNETLKQILIAGAGALGANILWDGAKKLGSKPKKKRYVEDDEDEDEDDDKK